MPYGRGVTGKHVFRIRQRHIAEHLIPLMTKRSLGAAKLDLVLRGIALPADAGERPEPGIVMPRYGYEELYDLVNTGRRLGTQEPGSDPSTAVIRQKRKWVRDQLLCLEHLKLVKRTPVPGRRPRLLVRSDDGRDAAFDDPDGSEGNLYITIPGAIISTGRLARWGTPELSAFLAAMVAERYAPQRPAIAGTGQWFRPLGWFADRDRRYGPEDRPPMPFATATLERGLARLEEDKLIVHQHIKIDPVTRRRLRGRRNLYTNCFVHLDAPELRELATLAAAVGPPPSHQRPAVSIGSISPTKLNLTTVPPVAVVHYTDARVDDWQSPAAPGRAPCPRPRHRGDPRCSPDHRDRL